MADQAITALPKKTYSGSSQIASTDYLLGIDSAEGYQMLIQDLGEYIINRVTASLAGSTQTLASAISALNSNLNNIGSTSSSVSVSSTRAILLEGGAYTAGKLLVIQFTFKAIVSASNSPSVANILSHLPCDAVLTALDITSGIGTAITGGVPCGVSTTGLVYIKEIVADHIYAVSGVVRVS